MRAGYRVSADLVRYHQIGVASGWVEIDGARTEITPEDWQYHGEWRGPGTHLDGERIADCSTYENARRLHQIRDTVVRITDPVGGGVGYGNCQPIITGGDTALGLAKETTFL
ncbi:hypothetical protein [Nocardia sp. NPDC020380]|uniref:hypothetical protein n=1 Tax=Nocardia sp. NPDC020380 TaxID=3364309 RepID=UPI003794ABA1